MKKIIIIALAFFIMAAISCEKETLPPPKPPVECLILVTAEGDTIKIY